MKDSSQVIGRKIAMTTQNSPSTFTFVAVTAYTVALFLLSGLIVGNLSFGGTWLVLVVVLALALAFTGAALREGREGVSSAIVPAPLAETPTPTPAAPFSPPTSEPDDLTKLEGIGPTISKALIAQGIDTFEKVAAKTVDDLQAATDAEGVRFSPSAESWAEQASYAAKGDWDGLAALQDTLVSGRYPKADES